MTGVQHRTVADDEGDLRLDRWFKRHFPNLTHGRLEKMLRKGEVRVDGKRAKSNQRLEPGQDLRIPPMPTADDPPPDRPRSGKADPRLIKTLEHSMLFEDEDVLVFNKPAGVATQGGSGVSVHIDGVLDAFARKGDRPRLVHRLDKDTSGVLVLGRTARAAADLAEAFRQRDSQKLYWAVVVGCPEVPDGTLEGAVSKSGGPKGERMWIDVEAGKAAITDFQVISSAAGKVSWLDLRPRTGRTHQLRVHCAAMDTPILGDGKYGGRTAFLADLPGAKTLHLFARQLILPRTGKPYLNVTAPVPPHMAETFAYFGFEEGAAPRLDGPVH